MQNSQNKSLVVGMPGNSTCNEVQIGGRGETTIRNAAPDLTSCVEGQRMPVGIFTTIGPS